MAGRAAGSAQAKQQVYPGVQASMVHKALGIIVSSRTFELLRSTAHLAVEAQRSAAPNRGRACITRQREGTRLSSGHDKAIHLSKAASGCTDHTCLYPGYSTSSNSSGGSC